MFKPILRKFTDNERLVNAADFVFKMLLIYGGWKLFYFFVSQPSCPLNAAWLHFNDWLAAITIYPVAYILKNILGYKLIYTPRNVIVFGTDGLYLANHCLGIPPMVIFTGFILAYRGSAAYKLWYIPAGVFCIYAINVVRLIALALTEVCCSRIFFGLMHSYVYLLFSYGMFFILVLIWMNYLSKKGAVK